MATLTLSTIEHEIIKLASDINDKLKIGIDVNVNSCPGKEGFASQVLVDMIPSLEDALGITIPNNFYPFYDKKNRKQLTIKEASEKLFNITKHGK